MDRRICPADLSMEVNDIFVAAFSFDEQLLLAHSRLINMRDR